jgi:hypothetical protein
MDNSIIDMKATMLGMTPEERIKLLKEVSLEEQIRALKEENDKLKAKRVARLPLNNSDMYKAKVAVIQAFVKVEQVGLDCLKPGQLDAVMAQAVPESSKEQRRMVLNSMVEAKTVERNNKRGAGSAFFRVK